MKFLFGLRKNGQRIISGSENRQTYRRIFNILQKESKRNQNHVFKINKKSTEIVKMLVANIEDSEPIGLIEIIAISRAINRKIRIINRENNISFYLGNSVIPPVEIEFSDGHWTLKNGKNPNLSQWKNNCVFEAISEEINMSPQIIRRKTVQEMRMNENYYARILEKIMENKNWMDALNWMVGGARYTGNSASEAGRVIDNSQNGRCYPRGLKGHPRGHASHPSATGSDDSVENYSRGGWKTGFLSRNDQNFVGNLAFNTSDAQRALESLNNGSSDEAVTLSVRELGTDDLPLASEFRNGSASGSAQRISRLTIVMRHHLQEKDNRMADVFIHTFYPRL